MKIIGVTGNTGSGKSTVSAYFEKQGGFIIDADKIGHEVIRKGTPAYSEIIDTLGTEFLDGNGEIVRKKLGDAVFSEFEKLRLLTYITHKYIIRECDAIIERVKRERSHPFTVIDAPLLFEAGMDGICDKIIIVTADEETRLGRIMARDGITREQAEDRVNSQTRGYRCCEKAVFLENGGTAGELECMIEGLGITGVEDNA